MGMLQKGRVVADGKKGEILTGINLSKLLGTHLEVTERDGWYRYWQP